MKLFLSISGWICFIIFLFWYKECSPKYEVGKVQIKPVIDRQFIHDQPKPAKIVYRDSGRTIIQRLIMPAVHDTFFQNIDTLELIRDYFAHVYYNDTVVSKFGFVVIKDTVYRNRIAGRGVGMEFSIPEKTITEIPKPRLQFFAGFDIGFGIGAGTALKTKSDRIISLDYIITQHGGVAVIGYKVPIKIGL